MKTQNILKVVVVVELLALISTNYAAEGTWTGKADMPTARLGLTTSTVDGRIYAIGGGATIDGTAFRIVEEYDPATDSWTRKADMPTQRYFHSASVVNGKVYVIGGAVATKVTTRTVEEYDPATDTWTTKADMPTARCFFSASVVNDRIYAIGGQIFPGNFSVSAVEEYDPATDTWTTKADMPADRSMLSTSAVEGKIYAVGGVQGWIGNAGVSIVEEYDPVSDVWTRRADMSTPRKGLSTLVMAERIVAVGGAPYGNGPGLSTVEAYDPKTNTWLDKPNMPTARWFLSASSVNGRIYAIGGSLQDTHDAGSTVRIVVEYDTGLSSPSPDFSGDGIVDIKDLLRLVESWKRDDPLADIAPPPLGDGVVDALDLELLMGYWKQPVDDPTLIAHWALDEADGAIASDSKGASNGYVFGDPVWIPDGGQTGGAISLDGIDDHIVATIALNPADGPFSVFAWVQGGTPGQTVISQFNGANWLSADPASGCLMTELYAFGRGGVPLLSAVNITDGLWHRIGFVWDGVYRVIYVDDVPVAEDSQNGLESSIGGLKIGGGIDSAPGAFWSGLIDDVRIYNRGVSP